MERLNMNLKSKIKCVIFDLDGTLLDSETKVAEILPEFYAQYEINYDEELSQRFIGLSSADVHKILVEEYDLKLPFEEFQEKRSQFEKENLPFVPLTLGAEKLVNYLHAKNIPMAIATNSLMTDVTHKLVPHQNLFDKFHHITTRDAVDVGKPDPKIYFVCLSLFSQEYKPEETLVFEDSLSGGTAAVQAGMNVVFIWNPKATKNDLKSFVKCIKSLDEFNPAEFGLGEYDDKSCKLCIGN